MLNKNGKFDYTMVNEVFIRLMWRFSLKEKTFMTMCLLERMEKDIIDYQGLWVTF